MSCSPDPAIARTMPRPLDAETRLCFGRRVWVMSGPDDRRPDQLYLPCLRKRRTRRHGPADAREPAERRRPGRAERPRAHGGRRRLRRRRAGAHARTELTTALRTVATV